MKRAYVSVTYLYLLDPKEVGLSEDCSEKEFEAAVDAYMHEELDRIHDATDLSENDLEVSICGNFD